MKRIISFILAMFMILGLVACNNNTNQPTENTENTEATNDTQAPTETIPTEPEKVEPQWTPILSKTTSGEVADINHALSAMVVNFYYFIVNDGVMYIRWTERDGYIKREASDKLGFLDTFTDPQNIKKVVIQEKIKLKTGLNLFAGFTNLEEIEGIELLDMGGASNFYGMFKNCKSLTTLNVGHFVMNRATNLEQMFMGCENLTSLDVSNWKTSNVTSTSSMFAHCKSLTSLDVSNWDVSSVKAMDYMFACCDNLSELNVSSWTPTPLDTHNMFYGCKNLVSLDVSGFNMSELKSSVSMFSGCENLTTLLIPSTNGGTVENKTAVIMYGKDEDVKCEIILPNCNVEMK